MPGEPRMASSTLEQALHWQKAYVDLVRVEDAVLLEIGWSVAALSAKLRLEIQEVNIVALVERIRRVRNRRIRWDARVLRLSPG